VLQAVEAKVLDNLSEQTTAEKSASKTAQDIKSLRKQGMQQTVLLVLCMVALRHQCCIMKHSHSPSLCPVRSVRQPVLMYPWLSAPATIASAQGHAVLRCHCIQS